MGGSVGLHAKIGVRDHAVAVSVMVIMIAMTMQLPSTTDCAMYNQNSTSRSAGNATWCDGHINMDGKCLQLNTKNSNNIADDQEGDLDWDLDLEYVMVDMVEYYSEATYFTRFLTGNGGTTQGSYNPHSPICKDSRNKEYAQTCLPPKNNHG